MRTAGLRILTYQHHGTAVRRYLGMALATPGTAWRIVRWSMRRPVRAAGLAGMIWVMTEILQSFGFFDYVRAKVVTFQQATMDVKQRVVDASEYAAEIIEVLTAT